MNSTSHASVPAAHRSRLNRFVIVAALITSALATRASGQQPPAPSTTAAPTSGTQRFQVRATGQSRVLFTSDAPLETVDGISTQTVGTFAVDIANPSRGLSGRIDVATSSLRTGNDLRDEHLRGANWFDASRFPDISLQLTGTDIATPLAPNAAVRGVVRGRFTLHGVTRDVTARVTVRRIPLSAEHAGMDAIGINADMVRVQGEFSVALTDYGVSVPMILRLKVSNDIRVRVDFTAFRIDGARQP